MPYVTERGPNGERVMDVYSRLLQDRILFLGGPVTEEAANDLVSQMLWLYTKDRESPMQLYINSPGGSVSAGLAIYDTMQYVGGVETVCFGQAASMGAVLLAAGKKGRRTILPNSRVMIHQPSQNGGGGQASDILIQAEEIVHLRERLNLILAHHTGQGIEVIERLVDRDHWMSSTDAVELGMVDEVVQIDGGVGAQSRHPKRNGLIAEAVSARRI